MEAFDNGNRAVPADSAKTIPNVSGFAPHVLEVLPVETGPWSTIRCLGWIPVADQRLSPGEHRDAHDADNIQDGISDR